MKIVNVKIKDLIPAEYNPRKLSSQQYEHIKGSLIRFGIVDPVIVNCNPDRQNIIVGGHQRTKVWKDLGNDEIPVYYVDLPLEKEKELNIRLNKNTGEFDIELLNEFFEKDDLLDWGFEDFELELPEVEELEPEETSGDDDIPEKIEPKTVKGDLYELGGHKIMCGDSTLIDDVEKLMGGEKADMVFTDPPYGVSIVQGKNVGGSKPFGTVGGGSIVKCNEYSPIIGDDTINTAVDSYNLCESLGIKKMIFWGGNYYANHLPPSSCWIVWDKDNTGNFADAELAWTNFDTAVRIFKHTWNGLIKESERGDKRVHPTQKPIALAEWCFDKYECDSVLDLFLGSGSTLIACEKTNRKCYGMELDEKYVDVCVNRYVDFCKKNNREWSVIRNGEDITGDYHG